MRCEEVREVLPAYSRDGDVGLPVRRHLSRCEDCTTKLVQYQSLFESLRDMRTHTAEPPRDLVHRLAAIPYRADRLEGARTHVVRNRNRYAAGLAVAAIGAAGAALWKSRRSRLATA